MPPGRQTNPLERSVGAQHGGRPQPAGTLGLLEPVGQVVDAEVRLGELLGELVLGAAEHFVYIKFDVVAERQFAT